MGVEVAATLDLALRAVVIFAVWGEDMAESNKCPEYHTELG